MKPEIEKCLEAARKAEDMYLDSMRRTNEAARRWEIIVVARMTDGKSASDAQQSAARLPDGRDALDLWRIAEIDRERTKYNLDMKICELKAAIRD